MTKLLLILLVAMLFEAVGVVFLSRGLKQIGEFDVLTLSAIGRAVKSGVTNPNLLFGVFLEAIFFAGLCYLLSREDVSLIWPLTALGFVLTTFSARFFLHETVSPTRWAGVCLIVCGAGLISWSEQRKDRAESGAAKGDPQVVAPGSVRR